MKKISFIPCWKTGSQGKQVLVIADRQIKDEDFEYFHFSRKPRGKRGFSRMNNGWFATKCSSAYDRSWKKTRKNQAYRHR